MPKHSSEDKKTSCHKTLILASIGSTLELYDFSIYAIMIPVLALNFFPQTDPTTALLLSFATFASGFLIRPASSILWGYIGDRYGRRFALSYTMLAMAAPTFLIGLLPTYNSIGLLAPILLVLCRICQGFSMSGEFNGAMIFVLEHYSEKRKGYVSGVINAINTLGVIAATLLGLAVSTPSAPSWAWRIPFILGAVVGVLGFFIRRTLSESPVYIDMSQNQSLVKKPLIEACKHKAAAFMTFIQAGFNGIVTYTMISFLNVYWSKYLSLSKPMILTLSMGVLVTSILSELSLGLLIDKMGLRKVILRSCSWLFLGAIPAFSGFSSGNEWVMLGGAILCGLFLGSFAVTTHAFIQGLFPPQVRFSGIAFFYNLGMSILGGLTPITLAALMEHTEFHLIPAWALMGSCAIYFVVFYLFSPLKQDN